MCVASDSRTIVVAMLLFVENEYEVGITVRNLGVSGDTRNYLTYNTTYQENYYGFILYSPEDVNYILLKLM